MSSITQRYYFGSHDIARPEGIVDLDFILLCCPYVLTSVRHKYDF